MNNFDIVLEVIRKNCSAPGVPSDSCINQIRQGLDEVYHEHIGFYLSFLHDLGLIEYDKLLQQITLTETGKSTTALFA